MARSLRRVAIDMLRTAPPVYRVVKEAAIFCMLSRQRVRKMLARRRVAGPAREWLQSVRRFDANNGFTFATVDELRAALTNHGIHFDEGHNTIYLPPQPGLEAIIGALVRAYPPDVGFKILKNFAAPESAHYVGQRSVPSLRKSMGGIYTQACSAACLHVLGVGPRIYDVSHLRVATIDATVLVSEHVQGRQPTGEEHASFLARIQEFKGRGLFHLVNPSGFDCGDFYPPDCNGNLLVNSKGAYRYVDPQLFLFEFSKMVDKILEASKATLHFGDRSALINGGRSFLYQAVPGARYVAKRDTQFRSTRILRLLEKQGASCRDRMVFDVCCNSGMMSLSFLSAGAAWAFGWDLPDVAPVARNLLQLLGGGRSTITGVQISEAYCFHTDLPQWVARYGRTGVLLFLAAWQHIGVPADIGALPWEWAVFEGHGNDSDEDTARAVRLMTDRWGCVEVARETIQDGISPRLLIVLRRN